MARWPHRLVVRTSGFHPVNRGSIPLGVTITSTFPPTQKVMASITVLGDRFGLSLFIIVF